jgi:hypothetical protein
MVEITNATLMTTAALALILGTLLFASLGIAAERDFFLVLGLAAIIVGNGGFALVLWDASAVKNDEHAALFLCLCAFACFALRAQLQKFAEHGFADEDVDDMVASAPPPPPRAAAPPAGATDDDAALDSQPLLLAGRARGGGARRRRAA